MSNLFTTMFCSAALLLSGAAHGADLRVDVDGIKSADGRIMVAVFNVADTFLKRPFKSSAAAADVNGSSVVIKDLPAGEYAVSLFQDVNGNGKLDMNTTGVPTEPYGFSNNASATMGPPSFEQARFSQVSEGATIRVTLH